MEGWHDSTAGKARKAAAARQPVIEAERLFANLTEQADGRDAGGHPPPAFLIAPDPPAPPSPAPPPPGDPPSAAVEAPPVAPPEVMELVRAALDATDRIAEVVDDLGSTVDATAVDVAALGRAIEQALDATNERLAFVEHILLDEDAPGVEASNQAMARLRRALRRSTERSEGEPGDGSLVGSMSAAGADGDDLDRVRLRLVGLEAVDDPEPHWPLIGKVKAQAPAPQQIPGDVTDAEQLADLAVLRQISDRL